MEQGSAKGSALAAAAQSPVDGGVEDSLALAKRAPEPARPAAPGLPPRLPRRGHKSLTSHPRAGHSPGRQRGRRLRRLPTACRTPRKTSPLRARHASNSDNA